MVTPVLSTHYSTAFELLTNEGGTLIHENDQKILHNFVFIIMMSITSLKLQNNENGQRFSVSDAIKHFFDCKGENII